MRDACTTECTMYGWRSGFGMGVSRSITHEGAVGDDPVGRMQQNDGQVPFRQRRRARRDPARPFRRGERAIPNESDWRGSRPEDETVVLEGSEKHTSELPSPDPPVCRLPPPKNTVSPSVSRKNTALAPTPPTH